MLPSHLRDTALPVDRSCVQDAVRRRGGAARIFSAARACVQFPFAKVMTGAAVFAILGSPGPAHATEVVAAAASGRQETEWIRAASETPIELPTSDWRRRRDPGGFAALSLDPDRRVLGFSYGRNGDGVEITAVMENSPAQKAGLRAGDTILKIDGNEIRGLDEQAVKRIFDGKETFVFLLRTRDGVLRSLGVTKQRLRDFRVRR